MRKINNDCPFTAEELDEFYTALYNVNTSFQCVNPAPLSWVTGWQRNDAKRKR